MGFQHNEIRRSHQHEALHAALYVEALMQLLQEVHKPGMHIDDAMEQPVKMLQDLRMPLHKQVCRSQSWRVQVKAMTPMICVPQDLLKCTSVIVQAACKSCVSLACAPP